MGSLQTELAKVQLLNNLTFDDDPADTPAVTPAGGTSEIEQLLMQTGSQRRSIWDYFRANPMSSGAAAAEALGIQAAKVHRQIANMYRYSMLSRQLINGTYHYTPTSTEYPVRAHNPNLLKAWAKRSELAREGTLSTRYLEKKIERKVVAEMTKKRGRPRKIDKPVEPPTEVVQKRKTFKVIGKAPPPPVPQEPVKETAQAVPAYDPSVVSTWPVSMAKAFYVELKKYFGEV